MTDKYSDLKKAAEAVLADDHAGLSRDNSWAEFDALATPATVLALLADLEASEACTRLAGVAAEMQIHDAVGRAANDYMLVVLERDQLKAVNFYYFIGKQAQDEEIAKLKAEAESLRADAERYRFACANLINLASWSDADIDNEMRQEPQQ